MTLEEAMELLPPIWTIYDHPMDYPNDYVVRVWYGEVPHPAIWKCKTLTRAREIVHINGGGTKFGAL